MYACPGGTTQLAVKVLLMAAAPTLFWQRASGVHAHPDGSEAGAKSMRQAIDAAVQGINLLEYAKSHKEPAKNVENLTDIQKNFDLMK